MAAIYRTQEGDCVDFICFRFYGATDGGQPEAVYEANRGIADYGPELPSNVSIVLPDVKPREQETIHLFGSA